ncbi:SDR family oxidoreductase [Microbacterium sp. LWH7-1.2]|uniref:SDR family NAD(P)-dependent oxidoreductase n=1 Tax=Microbacterium sp. LWH7-1.2 TaxID=3135257 RepID=UPI003139F375
MAETSFDFLHFPDDAVAVVTGAASGIGRATADTLLAAGVAVSGWDLSADAIAEWADAATAAGGRAIGLTVDVTDAAAVGQAFEQTTERLGPAGFLVNNAGPASTSEFAFDDALRISAGSVELVTRTWLATEGSADGHVVNISSVAGFHIGVGQSWYPAAKAAIAGYTKYLALNRPNGIRANAVAPGMTITPRTREFYVESEAGKAIVDRNPFKRPGQPEDIAAAIVFLLAPVSTYVNGLLVPVDGGSLLTQ